MIKHGKECRKIYEVLISQNILPVLLKHEAIGEVQATIQHKSYHLSKDKRKMGAR